MRSNFAVKLRQMMTCAGRRYGASVIEFMIVLPLLLLLFIGIFEIGRMMAQSDTLSQDLCAAALYGAGLPGAPAVRRDKTETMARKLFDANAKKEFESDPPVTPTFVAEFNSDTDKMWVKLSFQGILRILLPEIFGREIFRRCIMPDLGSGIFEYADDFTNPEPPFCDVGDQTNPCPPTASGQHPTPVPVCTDYPQLCQNVTPAPTLGPYTAIPVPTEVPIA